MKIWIRKMISVLAVCAMVIGLGVPVRTQAAQPDTDTYVQQLIAYYRDDQEDAETDIARVLSEMAEVDAQKAEAWTQIMDYWSYVNTDMPVNLNVAPDGLAQDARLCIVILGFALNSDGTMKDELIGWPARMPFLTFDEIDPLGEDEEDEEAVEEEDVK